MNKAANKYSLKLMKGANKIIATRYSIFKH